MINSFYKLMHMYCKFIAVMNNIAIIYKTMESSLIRKHCMLIRSIFIALILIPLSIFVGYAQEDEPVDVFEIGPYMVEYYGLGVATRRVKENLSAEAIEIICDELGIQQNQITIVKPDRYRHGVQVNASMGMSSKTSNTFIISGSWKQQMEDVIYLNAGLSLGVSNGVYGSQNSVNQYLRKDLMFEVGIPISMEITNLYRNYESSTLYGSIGLTPTYYKTIDVNEVIVADVPNKGVKDYGFLVSPRFDFGGYIPLFGQILRIGVYGEYKICCMQNIGVYKKRVSRSVLGVNIGMVF